MMPFLTSSPTIIKFCLNGTALAILPRRWVCWPTRSVSNAFMAVTQEKWIAILLLVVGMLSVAGSYTKLSLTADERFHVECGMEWWHQGTYTFDPHDPPLP